MVDLFAALPFDHLYASNVISGEVRDNLIIIPVLFLDLKIQLCRFAYTHKHREVTPFSVDCINVPPSTHYLPIDMMVLVTYPIHHVFITTDISRARSYDTN